MDSTNYRPRIAIVYTSVTGNTEELSRIIGSCFSDEVNVSLFRIAEFPLSWLCSYDAVMVGTYTWGNGNVPTEMHSLYSALETAARKELITAAFGTGDSFYPDYCGAVDRFRDMLHVRTDLAVTLKVELMPQERDWDRCRKLAELILARLKINAQ
ncbi:flavodoxin domain-containing protein [Planococcus lenghuensis]|uniref:Flavodoxin n=1 Tax=Planococcus lenghuensis TaxID=2213202 RepID=A0A1Q2L3V3_9BACL|nr:flavodoxin domain-containing protein [Planococcus lenghuensis]AQQ54552.1 flavodoxin [Planococcus lenghuensis]